MFLGLWAVRILLSLLTAMGFFITTFNGVLAQDQPPITSNFSGMVYFQPVSSTPRPIDLESIPSVSQGLFLLPLPVLSLIWGEGVCQTLKGGPGLRQAFHGLF